MTLEDEGVEQEVEAGEADSEPGAAADAATEDDVEAHVWRAQS